MKCPKCSGAGYIYNNLVGYAEDCSVCHGKGEVQTNEEWFDALPTEEKAKVIFDIIEFCLNYETYHDKNKYKDLMGTVEFIKTWLEQPHKR